MSSAIFEQVVEATRGEYELHGTLGQSDALGSAFLARDVAAARWVLLVVPPDADALDVVAALSDTIPADAGACAACGFRIATWVDACPRCEHTLLPSPGASPSPEALRDSLRDSFHVVGSLPHVRGGTMYFGQEPADRRLLAFALRPQPDGQLGLDVVWEAAPSATAASVATAPAIQTMAAAPIFADEPVASAAPAAYTPPYRETPAVAAAPVAYVHDVAGAPSSTRSRLLPIGVGLGVLAAVAGVAFALTRRDAPPHPRPVVDTTHVVDAPNDARSVVTPSVAQGSGAALTTNPAVVPSTVTDSLRRVRRHIRDSVRAVQLQHVAVLTIEGDLPTGWSQTVNGASPSSARDVSLTAGTPTVIRIEAPGYCADTLALTPAPRSHQRWAPTLRGRPTVGDC